MREIKFRAWHEKLNRMIMNIPVQNSISEWYDESGKCWCIEENIMQFTGLQDKNGVDIYEGDNVIQHIESEFLDRSDWRVIESSVLVIDGEWCVGSTRYPLYGFSNAVIGNIHEK